MRKIIAVAVLAVLVGCTRTSDEPSQSSSSSSSTTQSSAQSLPSSAGTNTTGMPFVLPAGFSIEKFAEGIAGARVIVKDGFSNFWVSQPSQGTVTQLEMDNETVRSKNAIFRNMDGPHGLVIDGNDLYIAEETKIVKAILYSDAPLETIATFPGGGRHTSRTLGIGPDGRLYVSIGSSCDVCIESDDHRAAIWSMNKDGSDFRLVAKGLRNSVFFRWHPQTEELWATDMGRDQLGDNLPPEEVNIIKAGKHYGWPFCYGNKVRDTSFQPNTQFDCTGTESPHTTLPAHIAPLGLAFIPDSWDEYADDLLVAEHGSWNSSVKVGYKVVRIPLSSNGTVEGPATDFLTGFLTNNQVLARPVDVFFDGDELFITDDKGGNIFRITKK